MVKERNYYTDGHICGWMLNVFSSNLDSKQPWKRVDHCERLHILLPHAANAHCPMGLHFRHLQVSRIREHRWSWSNTGQAASHSPGEQICNKRRSLYEIISKWPFVTMHILIYVLMYVYLSVFCIGHLFTN